jgi:hypothetical protein
VIRIKWLSVVAITAAVFGCGGADPTGNSEVPVSIGDHGTGSDSYDTGDSARDVSAGELADGTQNDGASEIFAEDALHGDSNISGEVPGHDYLVMDPGYIDDNGYVYDPGPDQGGVGGCDPCGMGTIAGKTCAPNIKTAIANVKVWVDTIDCNGVPQHYETYSSPTGEYSLKIPCGTQTVNMSKGSFHGSYTRWIDKGKVTQMTSVDGCFPGTAAKIAVITGDWDAIENTLLLLRLHFTKIYGAAGEQGSESSSAIAFLTDTAKLMTFDILFLNCSDAGWPNMQSSSASAIRQNLKAFVAKGGSIYGSDYALPYLSETWPGYILGGGWSSSGNSSYVSRVVDTDLAGYLGKGQVTIKYGLGPLTCVSGLGANAHLFIESTTEVDGCSGTQMMASFEPETNGGRVIYTTFHNDEQPSAGGDMQSILEYTVFLM